MLYVYIIIPLLTISCFMFPDAPYISRVMESRKEVSCLRNFPFFQFLLKNIQRNFYLMSIIVTHILYHDSSTRVLNPDSALLSFIVLELRSLSIQKRILFNTWLGSFPPILLRSQNMPFDIKIIHQKFALLHVLSILFFFHNANLNFDT